MTRLGLDIISKMTALRGLLACVLAGALVLAAAPACAQSTMTPAATWIDNVATLAYADGTALTSLQSNHAMLQVQEILDVRVDVLTPIVDVAADSHDQRLGFRITNLGNGWQAFDLSILDGDDDFDPHTCQILVDWDGDGLFDETRDRVTSTTPVLAPGASVVAWVSCSIPANVAHGTFGRILLRAYPAVLRNGATESQMANAGNGGVYLVMGPNLRPRTLFTGGTGGSGGTGGTSGGTDGTSQPATFRVGQVNAQLVKTQAVLDTAGGARAMPGAIVTYSLEARFGAGLAVKQAKISDTIPAGSTYVPGSLTLDGAALSDADDTDLGRFDGAGIEVGLGDIAVPINRVVTFKVRINPLGSAS
jgi:uncharacterized repeat protein (TIGR01451 family)